jgi:hypothetical protein
VIGTVGLELTRAAAPSTPIGGTVAHRHGRRSCWRLLLLACAAWTGAAMADSYLVLSLLGDHLTTVTERLPAGGGTGDGNQYDVARMAGTALEDFVVGVAEATLRRVAPGASATLLRASDPKLYASSDGWFDIPPEQVHTLVSFVAKAVPPAPDARLLLIAPYLAQPQLRTATDYRGTGSVAGLGFYVSNRLQDGQGSAGFFGVFANFQMLVINLRSEVVERREIIVAGTAYAAARAPDGVASNALSSEEKVKVLQSLVRDEIEQRLPGMLSAAKP